MTNQPLPFLLNDTSTKQLQETKTLLIPALCWLLQQHQCSPSLLRCRPVSLLINTRESPLNITDLPSCKEGKAAPACTILITMKSHFRSSFQESKWNWTKYSREITVAPKKPSLSLVHFIWKDQHFWTKLLPYLITKHISKCDSYSERKTYSQNLVHYDLQPSVPSRIKLGINAKRYLGGSLLMSQQSGGRAPASWAQSIAFSISLVQFGIPSFVRRRGKRDSLNPGLPARKPRNCKKQQDRALDARDGHTSPVTPALSWWAILDTYSTHPV